MPNSPRIIYKRDFKHFQEQAFIRDVYNCKWDRISLFDDVEMAWSYFYDDFLNLINKHAPFRKFRVKGRNNPWFQPEIGNLIKDRDAAWARARKSKSENDWLCFRQLRNKCTASIKKAKAEFYLTETTNNLNDPKKFWKVVKSTSGVVQQNELPNFLVHGSVNLTDNLSKLNFFNEHFVSVGHLFDNEYSSQIESDVAKESLDEAVNSPPENSFYFEPVLASEVSRALTGLDTKKSAGPDKLDPIFLKVAANYIAEPLTHIFNLSLSTNTLPKVWKSAFVLPLLKGGDPSDVNNYRPISKLCIVAKILEKIISEQLTDFLDSNSILNNFQSGFRKQHSTVTAALKVFNDLIEALDLKKVCVALFIDLSKAFDTVDHKILITILRKIGISNQASTWFADYLSNRTQAVQLANVTSSSLGITKGVPQGSVLGPILFSIYINDLCINLSNAAYHFYADDTVIYCCASSVVHAFELLQSAFNVVQARLQSLKLVLNTSKSKIMVFSKATYSTENLPSVITAQGNPFEVVTKYKYLGFLLDTELSFKMHIENLVKKLRLKLGFFYRNRVCFSLRVRKLLVSSTFLPVVDYGDVLYMCASSKSLAALDTVYHSALRFFTGCGRLTHHCQLYSMSGWPSLSTRRETHWLLMIYKALLGMVPPYLCSLLRRTENRYALRSSDIYFLSISRVRTELGKKAFSYAAPLTWNNIQAELKLSELVSLGVFRHFLKVRQQKSFERCLC